MRQSASMMRLLQVYSSVLLTCPYHRSLASRTSRVMFATPTALCMSSFRMWSFNEIFSIQRNITIISSTEFSDSVNYYYKQQRTQTMDTWSTPTGIWYIDIMSRTICHTLSSQAPIHHLSRYSVERSSKITECFTVQTWFLLLQVASRVLKIPTSHIHITESSSQLVPNSSPTAASMSSDLNGMAVVVSNIVNSYSRLKQSENITIVQYEQMWLNWKPSAVSEIFRFRFTFLQLG